jgi:ATPase subunit of ABC transporter with duplicated ATPase domains
MPWQSQCKEPIKMILSVNSLSMAFGENLLFDDITFSVEAGDKIGKYV